MSAFQTDVLLDSVAAEVLAEGPAPLGVHTDANLAFIDQAWELQQPVDEFPRLRGMDEQELALVLAVAGRYLDFHSDFGSLQDDFGSLQDELLGGVHDLVLRLRQRAVSILRLTGQSTATDVFIRVTARGLALAAVSTTDPESDAYGYWDLTLLRSADCGPRLSTLLQQETAMTATSWSRRDANTWDETSSGLPVTAETNVAVLEQLLASPG